MGMSEPVEVGAVIHKAGSAWVVQSVDGDSVTVAHPAGFTREWTVADCLPPQVDMDPVDDIDDEEEGTA